MAAARRRVVYVVARNLIVLFVCDFPVGGGDYVPARRFRRAVFVHPGFLALCVLVQLKKDTSDQVRVFAHTGNSYT